MAMKKAKENIELTKRGWIVKEGGMIYLSKNPLSKKTSKFLNKKNWILKREYKKIKKGWE